MVSFISMLLGQVDAPAPESVSTFWTMFLSVVAFPFLAKALNILFDLFVSWRASKNDRHAALYQKYWALAGDAVAYVNAQTKALREQVVDPSSPGGVSVTASEARALQDAALSTLKSWLGGDQGQAAIANGIGIASDQVETWLRGLIQKRFETQKALAGVEAQVP